MNKLSIQKTLTQKINKEKDVISHIFPKKICTFCANMSGFYIKVMIL